MKIEDVVEGLKSGWTAISAVAAVVIGVIAEMVASPPTLWRDAGQQPAVLSFVVTIVVATGVSAIVAGRELERRIPFGLLALAALATVVLYFIISAQFSCPFAGDRMAIGWTYLPAAAEYLASNRHLSCGLLIADFTGNTDDIWPREQILSMWLLVFALYAIAVSFVATAVVRVMRSLRGQ
ncbi:hypothetical protein EOD03_24670 [Mesorhizobium sp. M7A.T.Ca.TU.009.01.1.2]|nr:hypothetical protein EOD03_24670 [Mesorhizobium sp. M7A.T.Ca.TU.009.01.1.2]